MKLVYGFLLLLLTSCGAKETKQTENSKIAADAKNHSYANIDAIHTKHLHLELEVDFKLEKLRGVARHIMENHGANKAIFDINGLIIRRVTTGIESDEVEVKFILGDTKDPILGQALIVSITEKTKQVNIYYETTSDSEALDWLDSALTSSKNKPYWWPTPILRPQSSLVRSPLGPNPFWNMSKVHLMPNWSTSTGAVEWPFFP